MRVPNRGWTPPVANSSPSSAERREVVPASPPGPAAKTMWSRRMVDSHPTRMRVGHRGRGRCPASISAGRGRVQRECRSRTQVGLAAAPPARRTPAAPSARSARWRWRGRRGSRADVRLGVARAVPVEVVTAGTPAAAVVLADRDLGVGGAVVAARRRGRYDAAGAASTRRAWSRRSARPRAGPGRAARSRSRRGTRGSCGRCRRRRRPGSCARPRRRSRSSPCGVTLPRLLSACGAVLPALVVEPVDPLGDAVLVVLVGEVRAQGAATRPPGRRRRCRGSRCRRCRSSSR